MVKQKITLEQALTTKAPFMVDIFDDQEGYLHECLLQASINGIEYKAMPVVSDLGWTSYHMTYVQPRMRYNN